MLFSCHTSRFDSTISSFLSPSLLDWCILRSQVRPVSRLGHLPMVFLLLLEQVVQIPCVI